MDKPFDVVSEGNGLLLGWHDPEDHREWVRNNKSLSMDSKVMSTKEAISKFVRDGDYIVFGGFGHIRVSMVSIYEIIRQRKKNLVTAGKPACHDIDCLIAAGCVDRIEVAYAFGHELRGLSPASRRAVETGQVKVAAEWSNAAFQFRFKAAASGVPWMPAYVLMGTDTFKYSAAKIVNDPFTHKPICLIPACFPDVAVIHVHRCDEYGNAQIDGILTDDLELSRAARRLILSTETIIPNSEIRSKPWETTIPYFYVDAVVECRYGSHPCNMPALYYFDEEHIGEYLTLTRTAEGTTQYLKKFVYDVEGFNQYLELVGGAEKLKYLTKLEHDKKDFVYPWINR